MRARAKRVTDPLNDKVKAQLVGMDRPELSYVSSGSEHDAVQDDSPFLSDLVYGFPEDDNSKTESHENQSESEQIDSLVDGADVIKDLLRDNADSYQKLLLSQVSKAVEVFSSQTNRPVFRRNVTAFLRDLGHNAAICKTKWASSGGLTAGNYEFIDVVTSQSAICQTRYIVDVDFAGEFEIARPTEQYSRMLRALPGVFVGRGDELKRIVKIMSNAAKRSSKSRDLHFAPWRKNRYMQMKWFGPYRRTTNHSPASSSFPVPVSAAFTVRCRSVGFDAVNGHSFVRIR